MKQAKQKGKYYKIPLTWGMESGQTHRGREKNSGYKVLGGRGNGQLLFNRYRVSVLQEENSSGDWLVVMLIQQCEYTSYQWTTHYKWLKQ